VLKVGHSSQGFRESHSSLWTNLVTSKAGNRDNWQLLHHNIPRVHRNLYTTVANYNMIVYVWLSCCVCHKLSITVLARQADVKEVSSSATLGKAIGLCVCLSICGNKIAISWDLGTWATRRHNESIKLDEKLASVCFKSRDTIHEYHR
jgi:hypothetical protein